MLFKLAFYRLKQNLSYIQKY